MSGIFCSGKAAPSARSFPFEEGGSATGVLITDRSQGPRGDKNQFTAELFLPRLKRAAPRPPYNIDDTKRPTNATSDAVPNVKARRWLLCPGVILELIFGLNRASDNRAQTDGRSMADP
jgi:hypothetical protein